MARAIRTALALTTVALALSGSGIALAAPGICIPAGSPPAGSTVDCDGVFPTPINYAVEDLTVVLGATDPTSSVTTNGVGAVDLTGTTGAETLLNYAVISSTGGYAVTINTTSGAISVDNYSDVLAYGGTIPSSITALYADSYDGVVDIQNHAGATIAADNAYSSAFGVYAYSQTGAVTVVNDGSVSATSTNSNTYGIYATSDDGVVQVTNTGDITAYGVGRAYGVYAQSYGNAYVDNQGTIDATSTGAGSNAYGVFIYTCDCSALDANADNSGTITATTFGAGGDAFGVYIYAYYDGDANVDSSGDILVNAYGANSAATGIYVTLTDGTATIDSSGTMTVYASGDAYGIHAIVDGYGSVSVTNGGLMSVTSAYGGAHGVLAMTSYDGDVYVGNSGTIDVVADQVNYGDIYGIHAYSDDAGVVSVDNSGSVLALAYGSFSIGIQGSSSQADTTIDNSGTVTATGDDGAIGINAYGYTDARVYNDGSIVATGLGTGADATGIQISTSYFDVIVTSFGSITATATSDATGIDAMVFEYGNILITTDGSIDASTSSGYGDAYGIDAGGYGYGYIAIVNDADITAGAAGGSAAGIRATTNYTAAISITGTGDITSTSTTGYAYGIYAYADDGDVLVDVSGDIVAHGGDGAYGIMSFVDGDGTNHVSHADIDVTSDNYYGTGVLASTNGIGDVTVVGTGDVTVDAQLGAIGIYAYATGTGGVSVDAGGAISVTTSYGDVAGILAYSYGDAVSVNATGASITATTNQFGDATGIGADAYADASVSSAADIVAYSQSGTATGIGATSQSGDVLVNSAGSVSASSGAYTVYGIYASAAGDVIVTSGDIDAATSSTYGTGILAQSSGGDVSVTEDGIVTVASNFVGNGISASTTGTGAVTIVSDGAISATTVDGPARDIFAQAQYGDIDISNTATLDATGYDALGMYAQSQGDAQIYNSGAVTLQAERYAFGLSIQAGGDQYVENTGDIQANVDATAGVVIIGVGIIALSNPGDVVVQNNADVAVDMDGVASSRANAFGIMAQSGGGGDLTVYNDGSIDVVLDATVGAGDADAVGIRTATNGLTSVFNNASIQVYAQYGQAAGIFSRSVVGDIVISNDGDIVATAGVGSPYDSGAVGILSYSGGTGSVSVSSSGNISAATSGDGYADATGVDLAAYDVYASIGGTVLANAAADPAAGSAYATGLRIDGTYVDIHTGTGASVAASADAFYATAIGLDVSGSYGLYLGLAGDILATATGDYAWATGLQASSYVDILVYSSADIGAQANGSGYAGATGVSITSLAGDIFFYNGGDIVAAAADSAVAVQLDGSGGTAFINQGMVSAYADSYGGIAFLSGDADDAVYNYGGIYGALVTGDGDDSLFNDGAGTWYAIGDTDLGDGDDAIYNDGLIAMSDAVIDLGLPGGSGNSFENHGIITVSGDNIIDMEGGSAALLMSAALLAVPSSNPQAFYNYGLIDFQDGAPDDTLTIVGDFAGDGDIALDVSGLSGTGDLLYIDGSVVSGSVGSLDVDLLDLPADGFVEVPVVQVSGDSVAGSFVLGSVDYTPIPFLTTNISLVSTINSSNSSPDQFALRVSMGVSDTGAIAALLPAGVQLLMNDVVGSWHKRVEGIGDPGDGRFSLWGRLYINKGKVDPDFRSDGLGGTDFRFEQKNTGGEAGLDFALNDRFNFGLILGKANANQELRAGLGSDRIDGTVAGGYGTFRLPRGFYFDLSHRRLKFDASIDTADGDMAASGEAQSSNAESGYKFDYRGFEFEGQLQHTHTKLVSLDSLSLGPVTPGGASLRVAAAEPEPVELDNDADLSQVSRAGFDIRKKFKTRPGTIWELHATMNRIRESGGSNRFHLTDTLDGKTEISGDSSLVDLGFTARRGLLLFYGSMTWQDGGVLQDFFGAQLGAKYTW